MISFGEVPSGAVLPIYFDSFAAATGEPITISGLATSDIEVVKGTSVTPRASDAGYVLLDTDGIDIGSRTGIHGFTIDTGDNTDAGFYSVGGFFTVLVDAVTIDGVTVRFVAATFRVKAAESSAGVADVNTISISGTAQTALDLGAQIGDAQGVFGQNIANYLEDNLDDSVSSRASQASLDIVDDFLDTEIAAIKAKTDQLAFTTANRVDSQVFGMEAGTVTAAAVATGAIDADSLAADAGTEIGTAVWATAARTLTANTNLNDLSAAGVRSAIGLASNNLDTQLDALPTAAENATAVIGAAVDGSTTLAESLRLSNSALAGKASGLGTTTAVFRDLADTKDRITATVDTSGNRTTVTRDAT